LLTDFEKKSETILLMSKS